MLQICGLYFIYCIVGSVEPYLHYLADSLKRNLIVSAEQPFLKPTSDTYTDFTLRLERLLPTRMNLSNQK